MRIVIRSDPATGLDAEAFSAQFPAFPSSRQLPITPPVTTVQVAEQHGFLDGADRATWEVAQRAIDQRADRPGLPDPAAEGVVVHLHAGPDGPATASSDDRAWTGTWPTLEPKALHLGESTVSGGEVATINWLEDDRTVQLLLRPAAEVTIELSSILRGGLLDHFQIRRWLESFPASAATAGRHPMVTPPLTLQLVHAVRKPLLTPTGRLTLRPPGQGDTVRTFDAALVVDTASTARLDISATWTEWRDDPAVGPPERVTVTDAAVQQLPVPRGPLAAQVIKHELGDTRHRRITYSATAVSRFRDCFTADRADPVEPFIDVGELPAVSTQSSARPPAPVVAATTPAFRWEQPEMVLDRPPPDEGSGVREAPLVDELAADPQRRSAARDAGSPVVRHG